MELHKWSITRNAIRNVLNLDSGHASIDSGVVVNLVTMRKSGNQIESIGELFMNGKRIGLVDALSDDLWGKKRKAQLPKKTIMAALAHALAMEEVGKKTLADELVCKWLKYNDTSQVRRARNSLMPKHLKEINCNEAFITTVKPKDGGEPIMALLLETNKLNINNQIIYEGAIYSWQKGTSVLVHGIGVIKKSTDKL